MSRKSTAKKAYVMRPPRPKPEPRDIYYGLDSGDLIEAWGAVNDGEATPEEAALIEEFFRRGGSPYAL